MASNSKLYWQTTNHLEKFPIKSLDTNLDIKLFHHQSDGNEHMRNFRKYRDNFNLSDLIESPNTNRLLSMIHNKSYPSNDNLPLNSTLDSDDDNFKSPNLANCSLNIDDCQLNSHTSTPERNVKITRQRYRKNCPPTLIIHEPGNEDDYDDPMIGVFQCSPVHSPFPEPDDPVNLITPFGDLDETLTSFSDTSSKGIKFVDERERIMIHLLKQYSLSHFAFIFIEEEVDLDLFLTLTDSDLQELGIKRKRDRILLLSMIHECNKRI